MDQVHDSCHGGMGWVSDVLAHNGFDPWVEPTVFATGDP